MSTLLIYLLNVVVLLSLLSFKLSQFFSQSIVFLEDKILFLILECLFRLEVK